MKVRLALLGFFFVTAQVGLVTAQETLPRFEETACPFDVPQGWAQGDTLLCGNVVVPEHRDRDTDRTLELAVSVYKAEGDSRLPPLFYLEGGPGGVALDWNAEMMADPEEARYWAGERDYVVFDQRGVGASEPRLECPEIDQAFFENAQVDNSAEVYHTQLAVDAALRCRDRLSAEGVDLTAFNNTENAADVNAIRVALGYGDIDITGASYGSRLALSVIRDFPEHVRSATMSAIYPLQIDILSEGLTNLQEAIGRLFSACHADRACRRAYPGIEARFYTLVAELNREPVTLEVTWDDEQVDLVVNGDRFAEVFVYPFYGPIDFAPFMVSAAERGEFAPYVNFLDGTGEDRGAYFSVQCDRAALTDPSTFEAPPLDVRPEIADTWFSYLKSEYLICQEWGAKKTGAKEYEGVQSDVPTLLFSGAFDATSPAYGELAASTLANARHFIVPYKGHSVDSDCVRQIRTAFWNDPSAELDTSCLNEETVDFFLPKDW